MNSRYFAGLALALVTFFSVNAKADFFDEHDRLFRNQELCGSDLPEMVLDFKRFMALYEDVRAEKASVEVVTYGAYTTEIEDTLTNERCAIVLHDDCYSSHCY